MLGHARKIFCCHTPDLRCGKNGKYPQCQDMGLIAHLAVAAMRLSAEEKHLIKWVVWGKV